MVLLLDNTHYIGGLRQDADADLRLASVEFDGKRYLVNVAGTIQKASSSLVRSNADRSEEHTSELQSPS